MVHIRKVVFSANLSEQFQKLCQTLAYYIDTGTNRHKICVTIPARHNVNVQMSRQAGTGAFAEIDADIETVRFHGKCQGLFGLADEGHHLSHFIVGDFFELADVPQRRDKQMAVIVRKAVEYHYAMPCPPQNNVGGIVLGVADVVTDEAIVIGG